MFCDYRSIQDYWIGLWIDDNDRCNECRNDPGSIDCTNCRQQWTWLDDTNLIDELIDKWYHIEPTGNANCGRINSDGQLFDRECFMELRFVCKKGMLGLNIMY